MVLGKHVTDIQKGTEIHSIIMIPRVKTYTSQQQVIAMIHREKMENSVEQNKRKTEMYNLEASNNIHSILIVAY